MGDENNMEARPTEPVRPKRCEFTATGTWMLPAPDFRPVLGHMNGIPLREGDRVIFQGRDGEKGFTVSAKPHPEEG